MPHEHWRTELFQVSLLIFQLCHLLLNLDDFIEFGSFESISTLFEQIDELRVVEAELNVKDSFLIVLKRLTLHTEKLLLDCRHQFCLQKMYWRL